MISLVFASVVTWTNFLAKRASLKGAVAAQPGTRSDFDRADALGSATCDGAHAQRDRELAGGCGSGNLSFGRRCSGKRDQGVRRFEVCKIVRVKARAARQSMTALGTIGVTAPIRGPVWQVWGAIQTSLAKRTMYSRRDYLNGRFVRPS
jgi:hypothetical protein